MSNPGSSFNISVSTANPIFPDGDLYVDTNSWVDIALGRVHGPAIEDYLVNYVSQDGIQIILWSPHSTDELLQCIQVDEYYKEAKIRGIRGNKAYKQLEDTISVSDAQHLNASAMQRYDTMFKRFEKNVYEIDRKLDIMPTVKEIMKLYGVPFKDAKHLAYMWHEETNNLVTNDHRFTLIPGINVFSAHMPTNGNPMQPIESFMPLLPSSNRGGTNL